MLASAALMTSASTWPSSSGGPEDALWAFWKRRASTSITATATKTVEKTPPTAAHRTPDTPQSVRSTHAACPSLGSVPEVHRTQLPETPAASGEQGTHSSPSAVGSLPSKQAIHVPPGPPAAPAAQAIVSAAASPPRKFTRKELADVAHENYAWRLNFKVPESVAFTHTECITGLKELQAGANSPVTLSTMLTGDALLYFARLDRDSPLVGLNFANGSDVGGGYKTGATAQEEDLCRQIPNLFPSLLRAERAGLYPFGPATCSERTNPVKYSDVLYTHGLTVARAGLHGEYETLCDTAWANISLVTAAAPNINFANDVYDLELMYNTVRTIFLAPLLHGFPGPGRRQSQSQRPAIVLGAWGCGAFGCRAVDIGGLFARALKEDGLGRFYREVHFAIPPGPNADAFREVFIRRGIVFRELGL